MLFYFSLSLSLFSFTGDSDLEQLGRIFNVLGTPTTLNWPGAALLPNYVEFEPRSPMNLAELFSRSHSAELDLLKGLLTLDPAKRLTATQALQHEYFNTLPAPCPPEQLPLPAGITPPPPVTAVAANKTVSAASIAKGPGLYQVGGSTSSLTDEVKARVKELELSRKEDDPPAKKMKNF